MVFFDDDTITAVVLWLDGRRWLYMATSLYASGVDFENSDQISIFPRKVWNPLNENLSGITRHQEGSASGASKMIEC